MEPKKDESTVWVRDDGSFLGMRETDILRLEADLRAEAKRKPPPPPAGEPT